MVFSPLPAGEFGRQAGRAQPGAATDYPHVTPDGRGGAIITSKLTGKALTTIPRAVRTALGVGRGEEVACTILDGQVLLIRPPSCPSGRGEPFATFWEWATPEDEAAFADL